MTTETTFVQLATEMEDLGLVPASAARAVAQEYANDFGRRVWVREEFSDEPLYNVDPASMPTPEADFSDDDSDSCTNKSGHSFVCSDENEEVSYCEWCGADGNG